MVAIIRWMVQTGTFRAPVYQHMLPKGSIALVFETGAETPCYLFLCEMQRVGVSSVIDIAARDTSAREDSYYRCKVHV